jgi:DNA polymerase sigma
LVREQIRFKENIALAISGTVSYQRLIEATGLSRRQLENGRKVREEFDDETEKAEMETVPEEESHQNIEDNDDSEADSEEDSGDESDESDDDDSILEPQKKKRANNGEGVRHLHKNRYRFCFLCKSRKRRFDFITGEEIQCFCHNSQWGGRVDTCKLAKHPVIVEQPRGGFEYEPMRSYQYKVKEMYI